MRHRTITPAAVAAATLASTLLVAGVAFGHARLTDPTPRTPADNIKVDPPCGAVAKTQTPKVYTEGQQITVKWDETIDHAGCWVFTILDNTDKPYNVIKTIVDDAGTPIPSQAVGAPYTTTLQLPPGVACQQCTLQLRQVMSNTETCDPGTFDASTYFSCADIRINLADGGAPPPFVGPPIPDAGTPTPGEGDSGPGPGPGGDTDSGETPAPSGSTDAGKTSSRDGGGATGARPNIPANDPGGCSVPGGEAPLGLGALASAAMGLLFVARRKKR